MKRLLLAPLLISISLLNIGFMHHKSEIKGIVCGDEEFFEYLKENFLQKNIYKKRLEIFNSEYSGWTWFFDNKTGQIYDYERYTDSLKPFYEEKSEDGTVTYKYQGIIEGNKMIFKYQGYKENNDKYGSGGAEVLNLNDMSYISGFDGQTYESKCEYFPIPKELNIQR